MTTSRILTEVQRQQKYLDKLPPNFDFPLFNAKRALESQRSSGYRNTAAAAREIVDNAVEAGADKFHIIFDVERDEGKRAVKAIAFIDNGPGMLPKMARYALSWGGGTHYDDYRFIGKFGFGLPNASINQTRKTEVYTRMTGEEMFTKAVLDIDSFGEFGSQIIPEPTQSELPEFVQRYIIRKGLDLTHGTVVLWINPDRLTFKKSATLKEHLVDDFGVTYRYLLVNPEDPLELVVEGVHVEPVDPIFLMPQARYYVPASEGGSEEADQFFIPVVYEYNEDKGENELKLVRDEAEIDTEADNFITAGTINVKIARFPVGFADPKSSKRDGTTDANRRFDIRKSRRGMSFVRAGREIQTVDAFPRSARDVANDLGDWPLLQSYAYHWGVETSFPPELDDVLGITNDKQGIRPIEDFWRVLAEAGVDAALNRENAWQVRERKRTAPPIPNENVTTEAPSPAEQSAQDAVIAFGRIPQIPAERIEEANQELEKAAVQRVEEVQRVGVSQETLEEARAAILKQAEQRRFRIEYHAMDDGPFYDPKWVGRQIVVSINKNHPFYEVLYSDLVSLAGGGRAKEAVDLLLLALAQAELTSEGPMAAWYKTQRKQRWSLFLETALSSLEQRYETPEEPIVSVSTDDELSNEAAADEPLDFTLPIDAPKKRGKFPAEILNRLSPAEIEEAEKRHLADLKRRRSVADEVVATFIADEL